MYPKLQQQLLVWRLGTVMQFVFVTELTDVGLVPHNTGKILPY